MQDPARSSLGLLWVNVAAVPVVTAVATVATAVAALRRSYSAVTARNYGGDISDLDSMMLRMTEPFC